MDNLLREIFKSEQASVIGELMSKCFGHAEKAKFQSADESRVGKLRSGSAGDPRAVVGDSPTISF
jgi:hypothetical protein